MRLGDNQGADAPETTYFQRSGGNVDSMEMRAGNLNGTQTEGGVAQNWVELRAGGS